MEEQAAEREAGQDFELLGFENTGCALLVASAVAALVISFAFGPFGFLAFPFVFLITLLLATLVGVPLLLIAMRLRRANLVTATLGGFIAGATVPALLALIYDGDWWGTGLLGVAGAIGGAVFWFRLTALQRDKWTDA